MLGNLLLTCTGQVSSAGLTGDVILSLNTNVGSRAAGSDGDATEALLLIEEPASPVLGTDAFLGRVEGYNRIRWAGVPLVSGGFNGARTVRLTNVRADAAMLGAPSSLQPIPILGTVAFPSSVAVPISNTTQVLGLSQAGLNFRRETGVAGPNLNQRLVPVNFLEVYPGAFKSPAAASGYANAAALGPVVGRPTQDTRFRLRLGNVPSTAQVYAPVNSAGGKARLVSADSSGAGGSPVQGGSRAGGTYSPITIDANGSGYATWEVTSGDPGSLQTCTFQVLVENATADQLSQLVVSGSLAPVNDTVSSSPTVPVPRFHDPDTPICLVNLWANAGVQTRRVSAAGKGGGAPTPEQREASVSVGSNVTYVHEVVNDTDIPAPNVVLRDSLAPGLQLVSCTRDGTPCASSGNYISEPVGALAPGASTTLTVVARVTDALPSGTLVENLVSATSDLPADVGASSASSIFDVTGGCTFTASGSKGVFPASGGTGKITIAAASNCKWQALPPVVDWLTVDNTTDQSGDGAIAFTVAENTGPDQRTGFIFGPMYPFPIVQAGAVPATTPADTGK